MDGNTQAIIAVALMVLAAALFLAELLIPSGGILGVMAGIALIASLFFMFSVDATMGWIGIIVSLIAIPTLLGVGMKLLPDTPIGRMLILRDPPRAESAPAPETQSTRPAVGDEGEALTDLRPVGTCDLGGKRYDCMAAGGVIRCGRAVRVVHVDGMQIKVREAEGQA